MTFYLKIIDKILAVLFIVFYAYYSLMGFAFGSETIVYLAAFGLIMILISLFVKTEKKFTEYRLGGLAFTLPMLYYDILQDFFQMPLHVLMYQPVQVYGIFFIWSLVIIIRTRLTQ